jgi:uncharacterized protein (TIGR00661 family)
MHILFGVQATGQGHISRARAIAGELLRHDVEVTWLLSGRSREALFDMEPFGNFEHRRGLSFNTKAGRIQHLATLRDNKVREFLRDRKSLDLTPYELVVTDYEPVTAWAARRAGVPSIGIGHQYAFGPETPVAGHSWWSRQIMKRFAPVDKALGLHWHPYAPNILPPILDLPSLEPERGEHILVYLPFEDQDEVTRLLQSSPGTRFIQYANGLDTAILGNVWRRAASVDGFKRDLARCRGVICNTGFELISECLHWSKPVLTKPLAGQMEQLSNGLALEQLGYARVTGQLCVETIEQWLADPIHPATMRYGNVAGVLAAWLADGAREPLPELGRRLWVHEDLPTGPRSPYLTGTDPG